MNNTILLIIAILIGICILFSIQGCLKRKEGLENNDASGNDTSGNDTSGNGTSSDDAASCFKGVVAGLVQQEITDSNGGSNGNSNGGANGTNGSNGNLNGSINGVDASNIKVYNPSNGESSMIFPGTTVIIFEDGASANGTNATDSSYADSVDSLSAGARVAQQFGDISGNGVVPSSKGGYSAMEGYKSNTTFSNSESADNITNSSGSTNTKTDVNGDIYNHASYNSWTTPRSSVDLRTTNMFSGHSIPYSHFEQKNAFPLSNDNGSDAANLGPLASNVIDYIHTQKK